MNPIGVHFIPVHTGQHHYQFIRDMQPGILKLVGGSTPDVQQIADGYAAASNALIYLRNVARSEQHGFLWGDPIKAAQQHVSEWHADIQQLDHQARERGLTFPDIEQIRILGVNEPVIELFPRNEDMSNYDEWLAMTTARAEILDSYMATFGYEANRVGYGAGLGNISSGQPANRKPGEYATFDWFPKTRKLLESTRGKNAYACHEYWRAESGPEGHADWHAWRFMHLDVDCDIDVLECGVDQKITSDDPNGNRGWVGHMDAAAYVDQHRRYIARARQDSRFRCETPFTLDGDKMWESFWVDYCMPEMVSLSNEVRTQAAPAPAQPTTKPHTTHIPSVIKQEPGGEPVGAPVQPGTVPALHHPLGDPNKYPISQRFGDNPAAYARFGLAGHNGLDFAVPTGVAVGAVDGGQVIEIGDDADGYGLYVKMRHAWGESLYAHLKTRKVAVGEVINAGQIVGLSGNTGNSTGPHLHLAIRIYPYQRGAPFDGYSDPLPYLQGTPTVVQTDVVTVIRQAAQEFGVDANLLLSLAWAESSFNRVAVSTAGAMGLLQLMPATFGEWSAKVGAGDPLNARDNARTGAAYLAWLLNHTRGDTRKALWAYNFGIGNVSAGKKPPPEVIEYASKVLHGRDLLKAVVL